MTVGALNGVLLGISALAPTIRGKFGPQPNVPDWLITAEASLNLPGLLIAGPYVNTMRPRLGPQADSTVFAMTATVFWGLFAVLVKRVFFHEKPVNAPAPTPASPSESA